MKCARRNKIRTGTAIVIAVIGAFLATIIAINLKGGEKQIRYHLDERLDVSTPAFIDSMGNLLGPQLVSGNEITAYQNGDQIFPPMLEAIRAAQKTITFETYIYWEGQIARAFTDALCDRARNNVKVHMLMDWVGTDRIDKKYLEESLAIQTLIAARKRGVKVEIVMAGEKTDAPAVRSASRSRWQDLLKAGVEIYEYGPCRYHCKVMIVDDVWVSVGSTNFDDRSFRQNDEANLNIYDTKFAAEQAVFFEQDRKNSKLVRLADFKNRPVMTKVKDWITGAFGSQL